MNFYEVRGSVNLKSQIIPVPQASQVRALSQRKVLKYPLIFNEDGLQVICDSYVNKIVYLSSEKIIPCFLFALSGGDDVNVQDYIECSDGLSLNQT